MKRPSLSLSGKGACIIGELLVQSSTDVTGWGKLLRLLLRDRSE